MDRCQSQTLMPKPEGPRKQQQRNKAELVAAGLLEAWCLLFVAQIVLQVSFDEPEYPILTVGLGQRL